MGGLHPYPEVLDALDVMGLRGHCGARVEGRRRHIPAWYEPEWDHVQRSRTSWVAPGDVDLVLEAKDPVDTNADTLRGVIASMT